MADPIQELKARQRDGWATFAPLEMVTIPTAARLVRFAGVHPGQRVLDVACGTGVVAITARRAGARVTGLDLTPELLARAKEHGAVAGYEDVDWREGDAEDLPFEDRAFDVVLSQFGHMFAPRPDVTTSEMLRVLKPGGTIAFATWPPEVGFGQIFAAVGRYSPPPPPGAMPVGQWGDVGVVRQRLGERVRDLVLDRDVLLFPTMSPAHFFEQLQRTSGPVLNVAKALRSDPAKLARFREEIEAIGQRYFDPDRNVVRMDYLMTRGVKA